MRNQYSAKQERSANPISTDWQYQEHTGLLCQEAQSSADATRVRVTVTGSPTDTAPKLWVTCELPPSRVTSELRHVSNSKLVQCRKGQTWDKGTVNTQETYKSQAAWYKSNACCGRNAT